MRRRAGRRRCSSSSARPPTAVCVLPCARVVDSPSMRRRDPGAASCRRRAARTRSSRQRAEPSRRAGARMCSPSATAPLSSDGDNGSTKRRRVEDQYQDQGTSVRPDKIATGLSKNVQVEVCPHPGYFGGLCFRCGKPQNEEDVLGVAFGYIHKGLRLGTSEIDRLRGADLKNLLHERKLVLILDLDHTLINSTKFHDISSADNDLGIQTTALKGLAEA